MKVNNYVRIDKKNGVRVTLTANAWVALTLTAGYFLTDMVTPGPETELGQDVQELKKLMPDLPRRGNKNRLRTRRGKKTHVYIPASKIKSLIVLMEYAESVQAGFWEGVATNIGSCLVFLRELSTIDLLGAVSGE